MENTTSLENNKKQHITFSELQQQDDSSLQNITSCNLNCSKTTFQYEELTMYEKIKLIIVTFLTMIHFTIFLKLFCLNITKIPSKVLKMKNLENIKCNNNNITELPNTFTQLTKLKNIKFANNKKLFIL